MRLFNKIFIIVIKIYQLFISPLLPRSCRFYPTCSEYALQAFKTFNVTKATYLSIKRVLKCQPFHPGGYDPLPLDKE